MSGLQNKHKTINKLKVGKSNKRTWGPVVVSTTVKVFLSSIAHQSVSSSRKHRYCIPPCLN